MITAEQVIEQARTWLGTPWHHQGRVCGPRGGVDCVGLFACVLLELGEPVRDLAAYRRTPVGDRLLREIRERLPELAGPEPGCLLVLATRPAAQPVPDHIGMLTFDGTLIHASASAGVVAEVAYDRRWQESTVAAFDLTRRAG